MALIPCLSTLDHGVVTTDDDRVQDLSIKTTIIIIIVIISIIQK